MPETDVFVIDFPDAKMVPICEASDDALRMAWHSLAPLPPPSDPIFHPAWDKSRNQAAAARAKAMRNFIRAEINRRRIP